MRTLILTGVLAGGMALSANVSFAQQQVIIPEGTVIELRMDTGLNSGTSRVNDAFKASVARSVSIDGAIVIPEASSVTGRVTSVQPAESSSRSGVIGVEFNQFSINGRAYVIDGILTSLQADERKQIIDQESQVTGKSSTSRNVLFIGGGAGAGAAIGAIAGGGKGAGIGALAGGGLGVLGALFSRGSEAQVPAGTEIAMQLVQSVSVRAALNAGPIAPNTRQLYATAAMVRSAQTALRQRNYYDGVTSGLLDDATRRSIAHYQIDNNERATGDLDHATVVSLGLVRATVDSAASNEALGRQRAAEINRKAAILLSAYQTRLGVRVDDIRFKAVSEEDLDLLLQVDAFAKAASWYEQSSRPGTSLGTPFDNFGRILLRSAERVEQVMGTTSPDRQFAEVWSSIQANLQDIKLDKSFSVR
jgi:hypothetical protein